LNRFGKKQVDRPIAAAAVEHCAIDLQSRDGVPDGVNATE
jgi:hypothetical protein